MRGAQSGRHSRGYHQAAGWGCGATHGSLNFGLDKIGRDLANMRICVWGRGCFPP
ncbi:hypothetical protein CHLRE_01g004926v5 [Chlamydomonas reinhardtii]|uniref:Uncharacterized protein n=1 Tax=Chlamydomonas reinhardtii TaxID=3055 RepID=A0A2K3E4Y9_CHLRE|nr:uncharacterized protein CHLRE_01g004926v5 [Chlamydomonas reinhardtii]PNW87862.1 hypothetical protein CHLRE_01g004926v5 [Chlamydomonas reinhardtii]